MAKQPKTKSGKRKVKRSAKTKSRMGTSIPGKMKSRPIFEGGSLQMQSTQLDDFRWQSAQQQGLAIQIGQAQGNQHLQRVVELSNGENTTQPPTSTIQRLTDEEKAVNLSSPRFAGDARLEKAFDNDPTMKWGEQSEAVKKVQQTLIDDGFAMPLSTQKTGTPDGIFGNETFSTVKKFQGKYGLGVDGIVGRETMGQLDKLYGGSPKPKPEEENKPEIEASEKAMGLHIVDDMNKANDPSSFSPNSGVWYDFNYKARHDKDPANYPWDEDYRDGYADPAYFERVGWMDWRLKAGVSASEGIKAWLKGLTIAECLTTIYAIKTDTLRAAIGDKKFDAQFGSPDKVIPADQRLRISTDPATASVDKLLVSTEASDSGDAGTFGNRPVNEGEWYYFTNHPKYLLKHPGGAFQGENAVYMGKNPAGEQLWSGLGISNVTEDGMLGDMVGAYNSGRTSDDYRQLVKYYATPPIKEAESDSADYEALYYKYIDRIPDIYRHDKGEYEDKITKEKILKDPEYEIDGTTRKGGFQPDSGWKLDVAKVKEMRDE